MVSFWMIVLATGEIYGGFMTFAPEWLTGNQVCFPILILCYFLFYCGLLESRTSGLPAS